MLPCNLASSTLRSSEANVLSKPTIRLLRTAFWYCGSATAAKMPMIKTTTNNSMRVNPLLISRPCGGSTAVRRGRRGHKDFFLFCPSFVAPATLSPQGGQITPSFFSACVFPRRVFFCIMFFSLFCSRRTTKSAVMPRLLPRYLV